MVKYATAEAWIASLEPGLFPQKADEIALQAFGARRALGGAFDAWWGPWSAANGWASDDNAREIAAMAWEAAGE